jgi:hypothetical protein
MRGEMMTNRETLGLMITRFNRAMGTNLDVKELKTIDAFANVVAETTNITVDAFYRQMQMNYGV